MPDFDIQRAAVETNLFATRWRRVRIRLPDYLARCDKRRLVHQPDASAAVHERDAAAFAVPITSCPLEEGPGVFERLLEGRSEGMLKAVLAP